MARSLILAAVVLGLQSAGDMPVARPSGDARPHATPQSAQPSRFPGRLPPLPAAQIDPRHITLDSPRRLSLAFFEPRPIHEVLGLLGAGTGFSLAIDADATGAFRGELKQLTLREALTTVLAPLGLDFQVHGTVIRVRRRQVETRLFDLDLLAARRRLSRTSGSADAAVWTSIVQEDVAASVADGVKSMLSERGTVHVDARAGLIQVTDFSERLDLVALYVETLQQRSVRQVRVQAQAFEVMLQDASAIDWRLVRERLGLPRDAPDAGIAADPSALRAALAAQGEVRMLWAPDVIALNNEPALLRMAVSGGSSLTMTIVPQVSADGIIQMSVSHAWEAKTGLTEADSVVRVSEGKTALIAGLVRPTALSHAELVVLLRPTVVLP